MNNCYNLKKKKTNPTFNSASFTSKDLIYCAFLTQENQILERRVRYERLTPETLLWGIREWGQ